MNYKKRLINGLKMKISNNNNDLEMLNTRLRNIPGEIEKLKKDNEQCELLIKDLEKSNSFNNFEIGDIEHEEDSEETQKT